MRRRDFITLLGGAAAAWPLTARAQQSGMRRIGWLVAGAETDLVFRAKKAAFQEALAKLGWIEDRNLRTDFRFVGDPRLYRAYAAELVGLVPDVILTDSGGTTRALQQQTQTIPIVFVSGGDPVIDGLVRNVARPEGNVTGF